MTNFCPDLPISSVQSAEESRRLRLERATANNDQLELARIRMKTGISMKTLFKDIHEDAIKQVKKFLGMCRINANISSDKVPALEEAYANLGKAVFNFTILGKAHEVIAHNSTKSYTPIPQEFQPLRVCYAKQVDLCVQMVYAIYSEQEKSKEATHGSDQSS